MKRLMKRWLAMVLVVLMVMGTLPTSAWAARIEDDAVPATPVVDEKDGVVDTLSKSGKDDDVIPINPVDPDPDPVDPLWAMTSINVDIDEDRNWTVTIDTTNTGANVNGQAWGVVLVPIYGKKGLDHPSEIVVTGNNTGNGTALWQKFTDASVGLTSDVVFHKEGAAGTLKTNDEGQFVIEGDSPLPEASVLRKNLSDLGVNNPPTEAITFRVIFLSKGADGVDTNLTGHVIETTKEYNSGAYLSDATYILNIQANKVTLSGEEAGTYDGYGSLALNIANTSAGTVYSSAGQMTIVQKINASDALADGAAMTYTFNTSSTTTLPITLNNPTAGDMMIISVPYFDKDLSGADAASAQLLGTATIKVMVVDNEVYAEPIVFRVVEGDDVLQRADVHVIIDYPYVYHEGPLEEGSGDVELPNDDDYGDYGLGWDNSKSGHFCYDDVICDMINGVWVAEEGSDFEYNSGTGRFQITFQWIDALTADGGPDSNGIYTTKITTMEMYGPDEDAGEDVDCSFIIPITIIVEPGDVPATYFTFDWNYPNNVAFDSGSATDNTTFTSPDTITAPTTYNSPNNYYRLDGWYTEKTGGTPVSSYTYPASGTTTVYAHWEPVLTVKYEVGDSTKGSLSGTTEFKKTSAAAASYSAPTTTGATGYHFAGWTSNPAGENAASGTITKNVTFTAQWEADYVYTVTYNANTGSITAGSATQSSTVGTTVLAFPTVSKANYHLKGSGTHWFTAASGGTEVAATATLADYDGQTLYAQWEVDTFTVKYHYSGTTPTGATPPVDETVNAAATGNYTLTQPSTETGWTFDGWYEGDNSAATSTTKISTVSKNKGHGAIVHVWGSWSRDRSNIVFDANGGAFPADTDNKTLSGDTNTTTTTTPSKDPTWTGDTRKFVGWSATKGGTTKITTFTFPDTKGGTNTYYAIWNTELTFDLNLPTGVTGITPPNKNDGAADRTITAATLAGITPTGTSSAYSFVGWAASKADATAGTVISSNITMDQHKTVYAIWSANDVTVTVNIYLDKDANDDPILSSTPVTGKVQLQKGSETPLDMTGSGGVYTRSVPTVDGQTHTYKVLVNGEDTKMTVDVTPASTPSANVQYWTAQVSTVAVATGVSGGTAKVSAGSKSATTTADGTAVEIIVLNDTEVTWTANPTTYFKWDYWDDDSSNTTYSSKEIKAKVTTGPIAHVAHFARKPGELTINLTENGTTKWPTGKTSLTVTITEATTSYSETWTTTSDATTTYTDVKQGLTYTVSITENGATVTKTATIGEDNASNDDKQTVALEFYTLEVKPADNAPTGATVTMDGTTGAANTAVAAKAYLKGESVAINADRGAANTSYDFAGWTKPNGNSSVIADSSKASTTVTVNEATTLTATFTKPRYIAYLKLTLNGTEIDDLDSDITAVALGSKAATKVGSGGLWKVEDVSNTDESGLEWSVTTSAGGPFTTKQGTPDSTTAPAKIKLYSIKVVNGEGNDASHKPTVGGMERIIVEADGKAKTLAANPINAGFTCTGWVNNAGGNLPSGASTTTTTVTLDSNNYAGTAELVLKPTYKFSTTVKVYHNSVADANLTAATVKLTLDGDDSSTGGTVSGSAGTYTVSGLDPTKTYNIWVNGFKAGLDTPQITKTDANGTVNVIVYEVTTARATNDGATTVGTSNVGLNSASGNSAIIPKGAKVTTDTPTVNAAATVPSGYRKRTVTTDGTGNAFWTASAGTVTTPDGDANDATTWTIGSMTADVTLTAHYVQQFGATIKLKVESATAAVSKDRANFTKEANSGAGTKLGTDTDPATTATVDKGGYVVGNYADATGQTLKNWTFTNGTLYEDVAKTKPIGDGADCSLKTVYFFPNAAGAVLVANVESSTYYVKVYVNVDNDEEKSAAVELHYDTDKVASMTYSSTENCYVSNEKLPYGKEYTIYTDVVTPGTKENTERTIKFTAAEADAGTNTSATLEYYHVDLQVNSTGGTGYVNFGTSASGTNTTASKIYLAGDDPLPIKVFAAPINTTTVHNRYGSWAVTAPTTNGGSVTDAAGATYSLPVAGTLNKNTAIDKDKHITLTVTFVKQYVVTVQRSNSVLTVKIKADGAADDTFQTSPGSKVTVDAGTGVNIVAEGVPTTTYAFKDWTIDTNGGAGKFTNNTAKGGEGVIGYLMSDTFKPEADSTVTANVWQEPTIEAKWTYKIGNVPAGETNPNPVITWTPNDARNDANDKEKPLTIEYRGPKATSDATLSTAWETLAETKDGKTQWTWDDTAHTYTLTANFLENLKKGFYEVRVSYDLGKTDVTDHKNITEGKYTATYFGINPFAYELTKVDIQVADKTSATASPVSGSGRDSVIYKEHIAAAPGIGYGKLTFTWYYADAVPTQKNFNDQTDPAAAAKTAAKAVSGAEEVDDGDVTAWTSGGNSIGTGTAAIKSAMIGKYIYAVVEVPVDEYTKGAVITNAIPVDYDAKITLKKDADEVGKTVAADYNNYKVYLVPKGTEVAQTDFATDASRSAKGIVAATHEGTDAAGVYSTKNGGLNAQKEYDVYVNDVEDVTTGHHKYVTADTTTITFGRRTKNVQYYSVTLKAVVKEDDITHAQDKDSQPVGETFTTCPTFNAATGNGTDIPTGNGVLKGSTVKAKANETAKDSGVAWTQDYTMTWKHKKGTASAFTQVDSETRTSATAVTNAYQYTTDLDAKVTLSGQLKQNTYTIWGDIKGTGSVATGDDRPALVFEKDNGDGTKTIYTFLAKTPFTATSGDKRVSFTVPQSGLTTGTITGKYTIKAKEGTKTTLLGYSTPSKTDKDQLAPKELASDVTKDAEGMFAIHIETTDLTLRVEDDDAEDAHYAQASDTFVNNGNDTGTHTWSGLFANYNAWTKKVTVSNKGNTDLTVKLTITKGSGTTVFNGTQTLGGDDGDTLTDSNGVTISNLKDHRTFLLKAKTEEVFTVAIPNTLENADDVTYHFNLTSKDGRDDSVTGPEVNYHLGITINPVAVQGVTIGKSGNNYEETSLTIEKNTPVADSSTPGKLTRGTDVLYQWYIAPASTNATTVAAVKAAGTAITGATSKTYSPQTSDGGKKLYLVVKGAGNATGEVMAGPISVSYKGIVTLMENTDKVSADYDEYVVYLTDSDTTAPVPGTTGIELKHRDGDGDGQYTTDGNVLEPGKTYYVWTNTVKETTDVFQCSGERITGAGDDGTGTATVYYYQVNIADTDVSQNDYQGKLTIPDDSKYFYKDKSKLTNAQPTAKVTGVTPDVGGNWVQKGTKVTFNYPAVDKDYALSWSNNVSGADTNTKTATYSSQLTDVTTLLTLNLYPVEANVTGTAGWVDKITMALDDNGTSNTFTTLRTDGNILAIDDSSLPAGDSYRIGINKSVTFKLPKAEGYTTTAYVPDKGASGVDSWKYTYGGDDTDGDMDDPGKVKINVTVTGVADDDTYDVELTGEGLNLKVSEDENKLPKDKTSSKKAASGTGSIPTEPTASVTYGNAKTQEIHLNYNYPTGQTMVIKVENVTDGTPMYRVRREAYATNTAAITDSGFTGGTMAAKDSEEVTLKIKDGLKAGTYQYGAKFYFNNKENETDTGDRESYVDYLVTVIVDPLPFSAVTTKPGATDGIYTADTYTVQPAPATAATLTTKTADSGTDATTNLTYYGASSDYAYKWVRTPSNVTLTNADVTWSAGTVTLPSTAKDCLGDGADTNQYTTAPETDEGQNLYLVIYAKNGTNAKGAAISVPISNGYTGLIKIYEDGTQVTDEAPDPAYTVKFIPSDDTKPTETGKWTDNGNESGYTAILDPKVESYSVEVSIFQGAADANDDPITTELTDVTITNANRSGRADYYTVNPVDFVNKEYDEGTGEDFTDTTITPEIYLGTADVTGKPVLSGQSVTAKAGTAWTQDYTLTWRTEKGLTSATDDDLKDVTATTGQSATDATAAGAYDYGEVTAKTFIGGRLDQKTYKVNGIVKNEPDMTGGYAPKVELKFVPEEEEGDTREFAFTTAAADHANNKLNKDGVNVVGNANFDAKPGEPGDTIKFTVVKGVYEITAFDGDVTTIQRVTINADDTDEVKDRDKETLTPAVENDERIFTVYVADADLKIGVTETQDSNHTATSKAPEVNGEHDNQWTKNAPVYYFNGTTGKKFDLTLSNTGNTDLTAKVEVYKTDKTGLAAINDWSKTSQLGTNKTSSISANKWTDTGVAEFAFADKLSSTGIKLAAKTGTASAGTITVDAKADNADDAVYILRFTSTYTDNNSAEAKTGPTVYYVFDLTVDPLPIKAVSAEALHDADGTLQLAGNDLKSVLVDDDDDSTNPNVAADGVNLTDTDTDTDTTRDIKYAWAKAAVGVDVDKTKFTLNDGTLTEVADSGVTIIAGAADKTYKPAEAEQGMNFYLIAYSAGDAKNASGFAVSTALYAQVTISLETRRTGGGKAVIPSSEVQIKSTVGETTYTSNTTDSGKDPIIVPAPGDLAFTADMNAYKQTPDDPYNAKYYFIEWKVEDRDGNEETTGVDAPKNLTMNYTVTKKATVIGYYDKLPTLTGFSYNKGSTGDHSVGKRTMTYTHFDGSGEGNVKIGIKPATSSDAFANDDKDEKFLEPGDFELVAGASVTVDTKFGGDTGYALKDEYIQKNLSGEYIVTFYDLKKGGESGYEGYNPFTRINITEGEKHVVAQVEEWDNDAEGSHKNWGEVKISNTKPETDGPAAKAELNTEGGSVTIEAIPKAGYVFVKWEELGENIKKGTFSKPDEGEDKPEIRKFTPKESTATVQAFFTPAAFEVESGAAEVYFGNNELEATPDTLTVTGTKDANQTFTVTWPNYESEDELKALKAQLKAEGKDDNEIAAIVAKAAATPGWLDFTSASSTTDGVTVTTATFAVKAGEKATGVNVQKIKGEDGKLKDVEDEIVAYVKIETNAGQVKYVPYTVDVMTTKLKIVTTDTPNSREQNEDQKKAEGSTYKTNYLNKYASGGTAPNDTKVDGDKTDGKIIHGGDVELDLFEFIKVVSVENDDDVLIGVPDEGSNNAGGTFTGKGTWEIVTPTNKKLNGTGPDEENDGTYTFQFVYTGTDSDADDYNYEGDEITLVIPVQRPNRSLDFADVIANYDAVKDVLNPGDPDADYSPVLTQGGEGKAPKELDYNSEAYRHNETITYLDEEPIYTVKLRRIGGLENLRLTVDEENTKGFEVVKMPTEEELAALEDGEELTVQVKLTAMEGKVWANGDDDIHSILLTATATATDNGDTVTATYELTVKVLPRVITKLDVTVEDGKQPKPEDVKPTIEGNPPLNDKGEDKHGNTPVKEATATWGPQTDSKNTQVKVDVEIDPNYKYVEDNPDTEDTDEDIIKNTILTTGLPTPKPTVTRDETDGDHIVHITQPIPYLMHDDVNDATGKTSDPRVKYNRNISILKDAKVDNYTINLGAYGGNVYDVTWTIDENDLAALGGVLTLDESATENLTGGGAKNVYTLNLENLDTSNTGPFVLKLTAAGAAEPGGPKDIVSTYEFKLTITQPASPPSTPVETCPCKVFYHIGIHGTTTDPTVENVAEKLRPTKVPTVTAVDGYVFRGWSLTNPATLKDGQQPVLVDPKTVEAKGENMTFYAVIQARGYHEHYVIGYPDGTFGPGDDINRASVATIIARAILPNFVEGANYGNPGNYSDVSGHWAESAIAYCTKYGVFEGMPDGTFQPNRPITRQEFALVVARLEGVMKAGDMDFTDIDEAGSWALDGIYTAYAKGWVNGYPDGSFKPLNNIRRDEAVKVFNAYLKRGVDADGLHGLTNYTIWPDVPSNHWAYYEIIEAANDHEYDAEMDGTYTVPETWNKCWTDARWGGTTGANAGMVSAGFQVWFH